MDSNNNASMPVMQPATAGYYVATKHVPCPYEGCDKLFTCKHNVDQHIREAHTFERPHACEFCEKDGTFASFSRPASLYRHERTIHTYFRDVGPRGRRPIKRGVGRKNAPKPVVPAPSESHINVSNDPNHIDPRLLQQDQQTVGPEAIFCWLCSVWLPNKDTFAAHGHLAHGDPVRAECGCELCKAHFPQQAPVPEQHPVFPKVISTSGTRDLNSSLLNQPFATKQSSAIRQPKPNRTLDFSALSVLDERLKQIQATQTPDPDGLVGVESSGGVGSQPVKQPAAAARPDSGIGFDLDFEQSGFNDYVAPFDFDGYLNDYPGDENGAADYNFN